MEAAAWARGHESHIVGNLDKGKGRYLQRRGNFSEAVGAVCGINEVRSGFKLESYQIGQNRWECILLLH